MLSRYEDLTVHEGVAIAVGVAVALAVALLVAPSDFVGPYAWLFFGAFGTAGVLGGLAMSRLIEREGGSGEQA
jgi:hypothetical protein